MKTPFRYQLSEYDCVPTTFMNALAYLFARDEIPPLVIHRIYMYTLDGVGPDQRHGHGTSGLGVQVLGGWLEKVRTKKFRLKAEFLEPGHVHLNGGNLISRCLNQGGAALLRVSHPRGAWHYVLALRAQERKLYCFDPYPRKRSPGAGVEFRIRNPHMLEASGVQEANLVLDYDWVDTLSNKPYAFGIRKEREALLLTRQD